MTSDRKLEACKRSNYGPAGATTAFASRSCLLLTRTTKVTLYTWSASAWRTPTDTILVKSQTNQVWSVWRVCPEATGSVKAGVVPEPQPTRGGLSLRNNLLGICQHWRGWRMHFYHPPKGAELCHKSKKDVCASRSGVGSCFEYRPGSGDKFLAGTSGVTLHSHAQSDLTQSRPLVSFSGAPTISRQEGA